MFGPKESGAQHGDHLSARGEARVSCSTGAAAVALSGPKELETIQCFVLLLPRARLLAPAPAPERKRKY